MRLLSMKNKISSIGTRNPVIVLIHDDNEDLTGAIAILTHHTNEYKTLPMGDETISYLQQTQPKVILFALSNADQSIEYYSNLIEENKLQYSHQAILMCRNKESNMAFKCCLKGLFDNYFVYQPLYEKYRLLMIIQNALNHTMSTEAIFKYYDEKIEEIDEELESLIEDSSQVKKDLLARVEQSKKEVENLSNQTFEGADLDKGALLAAIADKHVKPLLNLLEDDIHQSIDNIIKQLLNQKLSTAPRVGSNHALYQQAKTENVGRIQSPTTSSTIDEDDELPEIEVPQGKGLLDLYNYQNTQNKKQLHILVVEDNAIYRDMLTGILQKNDFKVSGAEDGLFALEMIKRTSFDLIIMDLYMPKLDGLNTTKKIRELSGGKDVPVIALTGNKNKENVKKWLNYGLKGYIIKPSSTEAILETVQNALFPTNVTNKPKSTNKKTS